MVDSAMTAGGPRDVSPYALKRMADPLEIAQAILFPTGTEVVLYHRRGLGGRWRTHLPLNEQQV